MRPINLRRAVGYGLLLAVGVAGLAAPLPRLAVIGTIPACLPESPGTAWLGIQLRLLAEHTSCAAGSYAAGPHLVEVAQVTLALSLSTLLVGLIGLALALGGGLWLRATFRGARAWLRGRLAALPDVTVSVRRPAPIRVRAPQRIGYDDSPAHHPQVRRGPPSCSC